MQMSHSSLLLTHKLLERSLLTAVVLILLSAIVVAQDTAPSRGFRPAGSYFVSDIETISTTNGNMILSVPLAGLPPGRNGLSAGLNLVYNSKLYDGFPSRVYTAGNFYDVTRLKQSQAGGWRYGYKYQLYDEGRDAGLDGEGQEQNGCEIFNGYIVKLSLLTPDGGKHPLRLAGYTDGDGYQNVIWDGNPVCGGPHLYTTLSYFTTDGTFLRLDVEHDSDTNPSNNPWMLFLPDGGRVTNTSSSQKVYDRNNNYIEIVNGTYAGHAATYINDQVGRSIIIEYESATNQDSIRVAGFNNAALVSIVSWTNIAVHKSYYSEAGPAYSYNPTWRSVSQITLPSQGGSLSYLFTYNANGSTPTVGWGEISSITLPSGAKTNYTYAQDSQNGIGFASVLGNRLSQKQLVFRPEHDVSSVSNTPCGYYSGEPCITETTSYGMTYSGTIPITSTITAPDGGVTTQYFNKHEDGTLDWSESGLVYKSVAPDGSVIERYWQNNIPYGNPGLGESFYAKFEFVSIPSAGSLTQTAIKEYNYDKNGNVTRVAAYDWVPYGSVPRNVQGRPYAVPSGVVPKTVTVNTYHNPTPDASNSTTSDSDSFHVAGSPRLHRLLESSEKQDYLGTAYSRAEVFYDHTSTTGVVSYPIGNATQQKRWDSAKGAISRPLGSGNSIATSGSYDSFGNPTYTTDANGVQTERYYGSVNGYYDLYPTRIKIAYGTSVQRHSTVGYDYYTGVVTSAKDEDNDVITTNGYDDLARPTLIKNADGKSEESRVVTAYSDANRRVIVRSDLYTAGDAKLVSIQHYDQLGRIRLTQQLENVATETETDVTKGIKVQTRYLVSGGNTYAISSNPYRADYSSNAGSEAAMGWILSKSDLVGRVIETQTFSGSALPLPWGTNSASTGTITTSYDAQFTTVTDQAGKVRRSSLDGLGRLVRVDEPNSSGSLGSTSSPNQQTSYTYDPLGKLTQVSHGDQTRTYSYTSLARLSSVANPESGTSTFVYDSNGNLLVKTDARSASTHVSYDALNRPTRRWYNGSSSTTSTTHNSPSLPSGVAATDEVTYTYDAQTLPSGAPSFDRGYSKGRLVAVTYGGSSSAGTYRGYDAQGRVLRQCQQTESVNYLVEATYRAGGLASETYPSVPGAGDRRNVSYTPDAAGRLASLSSSATSYAAAASLTVNVYKPHGGIESETLGNSLIHQMVFNSRLQTTAIKLGTSGNPTSVLNLTYDYGTTDNNGNVKSHATTIGSLAITDTIGYDSLNRVAATVETTTSGSGWTETNGYDRYGNRWINLGGGSQNLTFSTTTNRITNSGFSYDSSGNLTADGTHTYSFDADSKLKSVDSTTAYVYDGEGKRVRKLVGENTRFVYGIGGSLIAEFSGANGNILKEYVSGGSTMAVIDPSLGTRYTTADHLGSPRVVTNSSGSIVARHDYTAFGVELGSGISGRTSGHGYSGSDGVRDKFTGYERDSETGLDYAQARYYASLQGRFTSVDPFGASANIGNPQSFNRYTYVLNSPYTLTDPTGMIAMGMTGASGQFVHNWGSIPGIEDPSGAFSGGGIDKTQEIPEQGEVRADNAFALAVLAAIGPLTPPQQNPSSGVTGGASGSIDPCTNVSASDLNYYKVRYRGNDSSGKPIYENGIDHITRRHILLDDPNQGILTQSKLPIAAQSASKFVFQDNVTTVKAAQGYVIQAGTVVFQAKKSNYKISRGNIVMTFFFPVVPRMGGGVFAGIGFDVKRGFGLPTAAMTLVLDRNCKDVITGYAGRP